MIAAFLDDDGFHCATCRMYLGRLPDALKHLIDEEGLKQWTIDTEAGLIYDGIIEMAVTAGGE